MLSLTYFSSASSLLSHEQLSGLLASIRPKNASVGLTGVLLYADGNFVQTLEGPAEVVESTFAKIALDRRHQGLLVALREQIGERAYPDWSMGFRSLTTENSPRGFNQYMNAQRALVESGQQLANSEVLHRVFRETAR